MHNIRYSVALKASPVIHYLVCCKWALINVVLILSGGWLLK